MPSTGSSHDLLTSDRTKEPATEMKTMNRLWSWIICSALLVVAACGGAEEGGATTSESTPPTSASIRESTPTTPAPQSESFTVANDLVYMTGDERFRNGEELVDVLIPADSAGPWPVVVVLHGDPRVVGKRWSMPMATELATQGRMVFVPDWGHTSTQWQSEGTLREQWDSLVAQLRCAVVFAKSTAPEYGGDADHITVIGYSAGGNAALMAAMSDIQPTEACVTPGPGIDPQGAVSIEGDLLIGAPVWDQEFADDPEAFYSLSPWRLLDADDQFPVHILAAADTMGAQRSLAGLDPYSSFLATRHTDIDLIAELEELGILDDGVFSNLEAQNWAYRTLLDAGYEATWTLLPESRHANIGDPNWAMSDQAWQLAVETILNAEHPPG